LKCEQSGVIVAVVAQAARVFQLVFTPPLLRIRNPCSRRCK